MLINEVEIYRGLQRKAEQLGVSKGDLVCLGTMAVLNASNDKLIEAFSRIEVRPTVRA
jgi:hypothetical protein